MTTPSILNMGVSAPNVSRGKIGPRTGLSKVKTGCSTCRQRRVKCDEKRPSCTRCSKTGLQCVGYGSGVPVRHKSGPTATRALLPRKDGATSLAMVRPSSILLNESEVERRYFQHFQNQTSSGFSMNFDNSLWNRLILQTSRHEPFVRHAVVAIGAISKSLQIDPSMNRPYEVIGSTKHQNEMTSLHRKFAFLEYSKSLKEMKEIISNSNFSPRQALLASLLSFCFENFLGNRPVALYHAQAGHQILQNWLSEHHHNISHSAGISSPAPHVVEDDLVYAFAQLDLQIITIADTRGHEFHNSLKHLGDDTISNMPRVFQDVNEARFYWKIVMTRSYHFLLTAWEMSHSEELAIPFSTPSPSHTFITNSSKTLHSTPNIITVELLEEQGIYAAEISKWHCAFHPIWMELSKTAQSKELLMATMILINCIALEIMVAAVVFPDQTSYDIFLPLFQQIVELIETHVITVFENGAKPLDGGFLLDFGITCPLGVVSMRCRDRITRRKAIAILQSWFHEGPNDPVMIAKVGTFMMETEEEGNGFGIIPESSRTFPTLYCLDPMHNTILMQFCQLRGGLDGGPVWKEKLFDW